MKNYIGNNNEINKKKYKKSLPPKLNPDAGNVEHNIDMFNKASSGDANLSSAAGMNGMAESYNRDSLIARITEFGKHYNFDKYTDAQLNAMLNRLVDASNHKKKVLPKHQDKINIQSDRHIMNDDPSYNFDDPEREGEYRVENLREALNRLDHYCIDNDKRFHDLRSLYENIQHQLTPQEKQELKKLVDTTNDPDAVKAYLDSKDPQKKNEELDESISNWEDAYAVFINIVNKYLPDMDRIETEVENIYLKNAGNPAFEKAFHKWIEDYGDDIDAAAEEDQMAEADWTDETDVDFDESLKESVDNLTYDELIDLAHKYYKQGGMEIIEFWDENSLKEYEKEFGPMTEKQAIRLMKVMGNVSKDEEDAGEYFSKQTFEEGLNRKELETFSRAIFNSGDKNEALEIIDQIYQYDRNLSLQLKDMWDDDSSVAYNTDKLSGYLLRYLDESLNEDTVKQGSKWVNKGKEGTHGKFNTKKQADAQRKAMFANGYKGESLHEDSDEYYTKLISNDMGPAVQDFMNSSDVTTLQIADAVKEFFHEYNKIPHGNSQYSLDNRYDCDKDRFYQKYKAFVDKCNNINNTLRPTGYGKTDYFVIKAKELLKEVDYKFPYGWKQYKGKSDYQNLVKLDDQDIEYTDVDFDESLKLKKKRR